jgi:hypothetical protein
MILLSEEAFDANGLSPMLIPACRQKWCKRKPMPEDDTGSTVTLQSSSYSQIT